MKWFSCPRCDVTWEDAYTLWRGYCSSCPSCGRSCEAIEDTEEYHDRRYMDCLEFPSKENSGEEKTEEDLEAERETIHDEIAEALAAAEHDTDTDAETDIDADADSDGHGDAGDGDGDK